jgi:hypothetical protein
MRPGIVVHGIRYQSMAEGEKKDCHNDKIPRASRFGCPSTPPPRTPCDTRCVPGLQARWRALCPALASDRRCNPMAGGRPARSRHRWEKCVAQKRKKKYQLAGQSGRRICAAGRQRGRCPSVIPSHMPTPTTNHALWTLGPGLLGKNSLRERLVGDSSPGGLILSCHC